MTDLFTSDESEMAVLGSMLVDATCIPLVLDIIPRHQPEMFTLPAHQIIYAAIIDAWDAGIQLDMVTANDEFTRREVFDDDHVQQLGCMDYIITLAESVPSSANVEFYARLVRDKWHLRRMASACRTAAGIVEDKTLTADEVSDQVARIIYEVTDERIKGTCIEMRAAVPAAIDTLERQVSGETPPGIMTGFLELDDILSGLHDGEMVVVAARPSMGKSALACNIVEYVTVTLGHPVALFSLEMPERQITTRILCAMAGADIKRLAGRFNTGYELDRLRGVRDQLAAAPLVIDDSSTMTLLDLRAKVRNYRHRYGVRLVIVDYLQLMELGERGKARQEEVSAISRGIKALARQTGIPIVVVAQLNRKAEDRADNRPRMSDLRESGAIEQDADVVMLLHREEYYANKAAPVAPEKVGVAEIIVDKQRNGPTGVVRVHWDARSARFTTLSRQEAYTNVPF